MRGVAPSLGRQGPTHLILFAYVDETIAGLYGHNPTQLKDSKTADPVRMPRSYDAEAGVPASARCAVSEIKGTSSV
jgi:hypothetical protein